ncbi:MAG: 23S rRNA (adenine(2503)-C(2))-methyltransferase RlmN [Candidatus Methylomirabilia bacterium]
MPPVQLLEHLPMEFEALADRLGQPRYRGRQLATWLFKKGVLDFERMTDLPKEFRHGLAEQAVIRAPEMLERIASRDGCQKFLLRLADGALVQSVLMADADRLTLCLSTQVGCGFACAFCLTGTMGLVRNLSAAEIVGQLAAVRLALAAERRVSHLVYMGMGEPLANYAATVKSLRVFTDPEAFGYSPRRITVSTVGLVSGIQRLAKENLNVKLAISLHATSNDVRSRLMPANRGWTLEDLLAACRRFPLPVRRRITFEYVLLDGVNDSLEDALHLARLLKGIRAKVNLIPYNGWAGSTFRRPALSRILAFQAFLLEHRTTTTIRWSKGEDIGAACGQLAGVRPAGRRRGDRQAALHT